MFRKRILKWHYWQFWQFWQFWITKEVKEFIAPFTSYSIVLQSGLILP